MRVIQKREEHCENEKVEEAKVARRDDAKLQESLPIECQDSKRSHRGEEQPWADELRHLDENSCQLQVTIRDVVRVKCKMCWHWQREQMMFECCEVPPVGTTRS